MATQTANGAADVQASHALLDAETREHSWSSLDNVTSRRRLLEIASGLEIVYAVCVMSQIALHAQNCEHDLEISNALIHGVSDPLNLLTDQLRTGYRCRMWPRG
jgi:hypothetical protein